MTEKDNDNKIIMIPDRKDNDNTIIMIPDRKMIRITK